MVSIGFIRIVGISAWKQNMDPQNPGVVFCFANAFNRIIDNVRVDAGDRSSKAISLVASQLVAHFRAWRRPDGSRHQTDVGYCENGTVWASRTSPGVACLVAKRYTESIDWVYAGSPLEPYLVCRRQPSGGLSNSNSSNLVSQVGGGSPS